MRILLAATLALSLSLATAACDDGGSASSGTADATGDVAADTADTDAPQPCSVVAQDCSEPGERCTLAVADDGLTAVCLPGPGDREVGASCTRQDDAAGMDDCVAGAWCSSFGLPASDPAQRHCLRLCESEADCGDGSACLSVGDPEAGACMEACDPLGDACAEGTHCAGYHDPMDDVDTYVCDAAGDADTGEACSSSTDCLPGNDCRAFVCTAQCDATHPCPDGGNCVSAPAVTASGDPVGACTTPDWSCVGSVAWPEPTTETLMLALVVSAGRDFGDLEPAAGATVKACTADDTDCAQPLDTQTVGDNGLARVEIPMGDAGFEGWFEVSGEGLRTTLVEATRPIGPGLPAVTVEVARDDVPTLGDPEGVDLEAQASHLRVTAVDCALRFAAGVAVSVEGQSDVEAVYQGFGSEVFQGSLAATGGSGRAALLGLSGGEATVVATRDATGETLATTTVRLRPGADTVLFTEPAP